MTAIDLGLILAGAFGVMTGIERHALNDDGRRIAPTHPLARVVLLMSLILYAVLSAHSWRGALYIVLMPVGAYKALQVLVEPVAERWMPRRWRGRQSGSNPASRR